VIASRLLRCFLWSARALRASVRCFSRLLKQHSTRNQPPTNQTKPNQTKPNQTKRSAFPKLSENKLATIDGVLSHDIPALLRAFENPYQ
jgi:hypothetical protein